MRPTTDEPTSRRTFFQRMMALGAVAAAPCALTSCVLDVSPAPYADFPPPSDGLLVVPVAQYPDLSRVGGALTARVQGMAPLLIVHPTPGSYACTSSTCTHASCPLGFNGETIVCPCHGSEFALSGQVTRSPARQSLFSYETSFNTESGHLVVDLSATKAVLPAPVNGEVLLPLSQYPALGSPGGTAEGTPQGQTSALLVVALAPGQYTAVNPLCTHANCAFVQYEAVDGLLHCPCHGSIFRTDGSVAQGPASSPLASYPTSSDGAAVTVRLS
jgi:Rieske Fe-S protein